MCGSSRLTSLYFLLLVWWLAPPTSGVCLTGRPANPATAHSCLSMALAGIPAYPWCPNWSWASPRNALTLASGLVESLSHLPQLPTGWSHWGSPWGLLPKDILSLGWQQVMHLSGLCQFGDLIHLSKDLPQGQLWLQGHQHLVPLASLFSLSIFNSSMWAAFNTHLCASLTSHRASSCE